MNTTFLAIVRMLLSAAGSFLLGKNIFGTQIDSVLWESIVGVILILLSLVMSIMSKTSGWEMVEGFLRQLVTAVGGLAIGGGWIKVESWATISGIAIALIPLLQSLIGKKKSQDIAVGKLPIKALTGVKELKEPVSPVINIPK